MNIYYLYFVRWFLPLVFPVWYVTVAHANMLHQPMGANALYIAASIGLYI